MILILGAINIEMNIDIDNFSEEDGKVQAKNYQIGTGGRAAKQAISAARSGANVSLIGKLGEDELSTEILNTLRREGVMTSGIEQGETPSGLRIKIQDAQKAQKEFIASSANSELSVDQIPDDELSEKSFVLLQTEISMETNSEILERAKKAGATTIVNLAPSIDISQKTLDSIDYLVVNRDEAEKLAKKLGLDTDDDALKMAEGFSRQGSLNCVITIGARGCVAYEVGGESWSVEALKLDEVTDRAGAEDAYCGTLVACLQAGMTLSRAMKRASIAGSLACMKKGSIESLPTQEEIDLRINDIEDPVKLNKADAAA